METNTEDWQKDGKWIQNQAENCKKILASGANDDAYECSTLINHESLSVKNGNMDTNSIRNKVNNDNLHKNLINIKTSRLLSTTSEASDSTSEVII